MRRLVAEHRCTTVEEVAVLTGACRGCRTCEPDIVAILRAVNGGGGGEPDGAG